MKLTRQQTKEQIMEKLKVMRAPHNASPQEQIKSLVNQAQFYTNFLVTHMENQDKCDYEGNSTLTMLENQPSLLKGGQLKYYQLIGLNWLVSLYESGISGILADDMGLGKTIQTISMLAFLQQYKDISGPHLIIAPKVTLGNWIRQLQKWLPTVRPFKLEATKLERQVGQQVIKTGQFDVIVTSYEGVRLAQRQLKKIKWYYLVIDQAHKLKNDSSQISQKVRQLHCECKLLLTGTPLQNNLHELWSLMNFLIPQIFNSAQPFDNWLSSTELREKEQTEKKNVKMIGQLHKILKPFMLRRTKAQVEKTLPGKKQVHVFVGLSQVQLKIYRNLLQNRTAGEDEKRQYLNILMQLRKVCCHPYLFPDIEEGEQIGQHLVTASGKLIILDQLLKKLYTEGDHKVLLFSQMTSLLDILEDYCYLRGYKYCRIDGTTDIKSRESQIEAFQQTDQHFIFLLSTRAGGLGINLTAADTVILYDSDFNPQMDLQAMDRAYRIGQKKFVKVYRLITENTIEQKIIQRQMIKLKWDRLVIQQQRTGQKNKALTKEEMRQMLTHGANAIFKATSNTLNEELIENLLSRGEAKTEAFNQQLDQKLRPPEDLANLNMNSINIFDFMQKNQQKKREDAQALEQNYTKNQELMSLDYLGRRERNKINSLKVKSVQIPSHHFYEQKERLRQLLQKQDNHKNNSKTGLFAPLTQQEDIQKEALLSTGFRNWNKQDFSNFISAWVQYGKDNINKIAEKVKKSYEEVNAYATVFEKRMNQLEDRQKIVKMIQTAEDKQKETKRKQDILQWKMDKFGGMLFDVHIYKKFSSKLFSLYSDMAIAEEAHIHGINNIKDIKNALKVNIYTRLDFYVRSRTEGQIKKRLSSIIKLLQKEKQHFDLQNYSHGIMEEDDSSEGQEQEREKFEQDVNE